CARDGVAIALARLAGLKTAMVTGESSPIAKIRGEKLGVDTVVLGARRKGEAVEQLLNKFGFTGDALAYVGDDLLDVPALRRAGLAIAVADAAAEVKALAHVVTKTRGGAGAVRECVELILRAQGTWKRVLEDYLRSHGDNPPGARR